MHTLVTTADHLTIRTTFVPRGPIVEIVTQAGDGLCLQVKTRAEARDHWRKAMSLGATQAPVADDVRIAWRGPANGDDVYVTTAGADTFRTTGAYRCLPHPEGREMYRSARERAAA
jgi:hypothetical protein